MEKVYDGWKYPADWVVETFAQERHPGAACTSRALLTGLATTGGTIPVFADAAAAAAALGHAVTRAEWLARPRGTTTHVTGVDGARAGGVVAGFLAAHPEGGWLDPAQVQEVLQAFGLPVLASVVVDGPDDAVDAYTAAGRPVALKAVVDGVLHKAAAGGVP